MKVFNSIQLQDVGLQFQDIMTLLGHDMLKLQFGIS